MKKRNNKRCLLRIIDTIKDIVDYEIELTYIQTKDMLNRWEFLSDNNYKIILYGPLQTTSESKNGNIKKAYLQIRENIMYEISIIESYV